MHVSLQVTFTPASLADLASSMLLETEQGTLEVPLLARRQPPKLTLPRELLVGPTLIGNVQVKSPRLTVVYVDVSSQGYDALHNN